jgi:hypothetical protein
VTVLTVTADEYARAQAYAAALKSAMSEGVAGAETLAALVAVASWPTDEGPLRAALYPALRALAPEQWHLIAPYGTAIADGVFLNTWANHGAGASASYCRDGQGFIHLRGFIKTTTVPDATNRFATMFQLPAGYRPASLLHFAGVANEKHALVRTDASGNVAMYSGDNATPETWVSLEGITFDTR